MLTAQKLYSFEQNVVDGVVCKTVKDDFSLSAAFDDARTLQKSELM